MKALFILAFILLSIIACSPDPNAHIVKAVKEYMLQNMDDPSSFEFVSMDGVDTVYYNESRQLLINIYQEEPELFSDEKSLAELDSLRRTLNLSDSSDIMQINAYCKIRGKNKMGALVLNSYDITFNEGMEVVEVIAR